jgi:hypothetical protein
MNRPAILTALDPDWSERYRGDLERAWMFYWTYARSDVERVRREMA